MLGILVACFSPSKHPANTPTLAILLRAVRLGYVGRASALRGGATVSQRSISQFFAAMGAPLHIVRQSWGAVRSDGAVVLRVWADRCQQHDGKRYVQLTHLEKYGGDSRNFGYNERLEHVQMIIDGASCYLVMCQVKDPVASPRDIKSWNRDSLFVGGRLEKIDGDWWVELADKIPADQLMTKPSL
ncbi:hypothetical protein D9M69_369210 [compost metagenome]